ncbi:MAG: SDR family NAD(P)-dependent oxidoreductase [Pseudomonadota bacterium]
MILKRRNIVLTGGTSGIGRDLVRLLHADNQLLVVARNQTRLDELSAAFPGIATFRADLAKPADVEAAAAAAHNCFDSLDLVINNAALQFTPTFVDPDFSYASIQQEIAVNFTAVCGLTALLLPALTHGREAAILNVNSGLALVPKTQSAVYCATKAAVDNFSRALRNQLEDTQVKVFQAFMPLVDTPMTEGRGDGKLSAEEAATAILRGVERGIEDHDIGKVRVLRLLSRLAPGIARKIMKRA